jgi:hypothetical protein
MITVDKAKNIMCRRLGCCNLNVICNDAEFLEKFKKYYKAKKMQENTNHKFFSIELIKNIVGIFDVISF